VAVRRNRDYESDLAFADFARHKLNPANYDYDDPKYADKTQHGARTFLTGGRTLSEAYKHGRDQSANDSILHSMQRQGCILLANGATGAEIVAHWRQYFDEGRLARAYDVHIDFVRMNALTVDEQLTRHHNAYVALLVSEAHKQSLKQDMHERFGPNAHVTVHDNGNVSVDIRRPPGLAEQMAAAREKISKDVQA
jgi:hypothetical protein